MFIVNPDPFLLPSFRISPFKSEHIVYNHNITKSDFAINYLNDKFGEGNWQYTINGREGIKLALDSYNLKKTDIVTIITTSNNFYISSCVTKEIELICGWNRQIIPETKIIFVNHEFGYPFPNMDELLKLKLPIIEDCCTTFFSQDRNNKIGKYGAFSIYSLPKFFPIQIGGVLVNNSPNFKTRLSSITDLEKQYIQNVLSNSLIEEDELLKKRKENFEYASLLFSKLGFSQRFKADNKVIPSVLLLNNNSIIKDLTLAKEYLFKQGIQCSVFYGEDAFFIPNHQNLSKDEINYIYECVKEYIKN